jgi:CO dehydrogenase maturation factor
LGLNPHGSSQTRTLAVAGKGGAGKTTLVAIMARILVEKGVHLLLVDADPPISLTYALGADPTKTLGELRLRLMEDPRQRREIGDRHIRDVILDELLKFGIESLAKKYDVALIDCEAGIEQINRRVINSIGTLIMVSDATVKGLRTASYLSDIAGKYGVEGDYSTGLVLNKVNKNVSALEEKAKKMGLSLLGVIPLDENVADFDQEGMPTFDLPSNSPSMDAVRQIASRLRL